MCGNTDQTIDTRRIRARLLTSAVGSDGAARELVFTAPIVPGPGFRRARVGRTDPGAHYFTPVTTVTVSQPRRLSCVHRRATNLGARPLVPCYTNESHICSPLHKFFLTCLKKFQVVFLCYVVVRNYVLIPEERSSFEIILGDPHISRQVSWSIVSQVLNQIHALGVV